MTSLPLTGAQIPLDIHIYSLKEQKTDYKYD